MHDIDSERTTDFDVLSAVLNIDFVWHDVTIFVLESAANGITGIIINDAFAVGCHDGIIRIIGGIIPCRGSFITIYVGDGKVGKITEA